MSQLTYGSLFSGIGGMDLGFDRAGLVCKWQVEIDDYARRVLTKHWPDVARHDDIRTFTNIPYVDIIAGGFPCQDISYAGKGAGLEGERSGLFYELIRVVREVGPRIVVLESVAALLTRGLDQVLGTLASLGFDAEWHCIPAAAVGAPHIRDRVFVIGIYADSISTRTRNQSRTDCGQKRECARASEPEALRQAHGAVGAGRAESVRENVAYSESDRWRKRESDNGRGSEGIGKGQEYRSRNSGEDVAHAEIKGLEGREARRDFRSRLAGLREGGRPISDHWIVEPAVGRVANGISKRVDRLRGLGNAVVPQVAEWIAKQIIETQIGVTK